MSTAFLETTAWPDRHTPNHMYLLEGDKLLAYIPAGSGKVQLLRTPITISKRGRSFVEVKPSPFNVIVAQATQDPNVEIVSGSKGATYQVNRVEGTCTCPGFTYRGTCKHLQ